MQIGSEMATLQEKNPKMDPKNVFSEKSPRILNFWKKFLKTHIKRANLAETDISGHEIYPKGPSRAMWSVTNIHAWNLPSDVLFPHNVYHIYFGNKLSCVECLMFEKRKDTEKRIQQKGENLQEEKDIWIQLPPFAKICTSFFHNILKTCATLGLYL